MTNVISLESYQGAAYLTLTLRGPTRVNDVVVRAGVLQTRLTGHHSMLEDTLSIVKNH